MASQDFKIKGFIQSFGCTTVVVKNERAQEVIKKNGGLLRVATKIADKKMVSRVSCPRINKTDTSDGQFSDIMEREITKVGGRDVNICLQLPVTHKQIRRMLDGEEVLSVFKIMIVESGYAIKTFWNDKVTGEWLFNRLMEDDADVPRLDQGTSQGTGHKAKGPFTRSKAIQATPITPDRIRNAEGIETSVQIKPETIDQLIINSEATITVGFLWKDGHTLTAVEDVDDRVSKKEFEQIYDQCEQDEMVIITTYVLTGFFPVEKLPSVINDKVTITYKIHRSEGMLKIVDMTMKDPDSNDAYHKMELNIRSPNGEPRSCKPAVTTEEYVKEIQIIEISDDDEDRKFTARVSRDEDYVEETNVTGFYKNKNIVKDNNLKEATIIRRNDDKETPGELSPKCHYPNDIAMIEISDDDDNETALDDIEVTKTDGTQETGKVCNNDIEDEATKIDQGKNREARVLHGLNKRGDTDNNANDDSLDRNRMEVKDDERETEDKTDQMERVDVEGFGDHNVAIKREVEQDDPLEVKDEDKEAETTGNYTTGNYATRKNSLDMIRVLYDDDNE